jgi:hypothetical protein
MGAVLVGGRGVDVGLPANGLKDETGRFVTLARALGRRIIAPGLFAAWSSSEGELAFLLTSQTRLTISKRIDYGT